MPDFSHEDVLGPLGPVAGVDEAGRGPWAGSVVAAAVILDRAVVPEGLNDSKKLTEAARERLFDLIMTSAQVGIGRADVAEIDTLNILQASLLAMRRAVTALGQPGAVLIDGNRSPAIPGCAERLIVGGDGLSLSIAAASIVAKVTRDREMVTLSQQFPGYGWDRNKGYGVKAHAEALKTLGVTPHHRRSFKPIHKILCEEN